MYAEASSDGAKIEIFADKIKRLHPLRATRVEAWFQHSPKSDIPVEITITSNKIKC